VVIEPLPWAGNPKRPLDDTNLGEYFFEVLDRETHRPLYSRGFSTWFDVWESTPAAPAGYRTFEESLRFPAPARPVVVRVRRRDHANDFAELWSFAIDPADQGISRSAPPSPGRPIKIQEKGPSARKVDLLLLGDGYTAKERARFEADARRLTEALFAHEPFRARRNDFNVWALCPEARDSGVSRPATGTERRSPLRAAYGAVGVDSYLATFDEHTVREQASNAPYDALVVLANSDAYGGSGIFNGEAVVAANSPWAPFLIAHEVGQSFAALAVENFTWDYPSPGGGFFSYSEPWQKNITLEDDAAAIKWKDLLTPGVAIDTPWKKDGYVSFGREIAERERKLRSEGRPESDFEALRREEKDRSTALLAAETTPEKARGEDEETEGETAEKEHREPPPTEPTAPTVGAYEGGNHLDHFYNRPQLDCVMFSRDDVDFCAVCQRGIEEVIRLWAD